MRSSAEQRQFQARVIKEVRSGRAVSRRSLAIELGLSPTTAGQYVDYLMAENMLRETGLDQGALGRPKRVLSVCGEFGWYAGLEFNAERVQAVRVDLAGQRTAAVERRLPPGSDAASVMAVLMEMVETLDISGGGPLLGIGMGVPGVVDMTTGQGVDYAYLRDWKNVPLTAPMEDRFGVLVTIDNNMRVIALAERWFGGGRDLDDYVILGPRSGFGVAVVSDGVLLRGAHLAAGEAGRWPWPGQAGDSRVNDELSAPGVWRRLTGSGPAEALPENLSAALAAHAEDDGPAWKEVVTAYARLLGYLQALLDTRMFFLHGPLKALGERFTTAVLAGMTAQLPELNTSLPQFQASILADDAGALGAASHAMEMWLPD